MDSRSSVGEARAAPRGKAGRPKECPARGCRAHGARGTLGVAMIHDVDEALRALVKRDALPSNGVEIAFDAPTKDWVARRNSPIVDLYLYDIREDVSRRQTAWEERRADDGRVLERRLPPRRFRLSYLVTAWTSRPEDEHRLLASLLGCFVRNEYMPPELLGGQLEDEELPVLLTVALPPPEDRSIADVWSALGGELKPSLDLVVTAPVDIERGLAAGPPVLEEPRLALIATEPDGSDTARTAGATAGRRRAARPEAARPAAGRERAPAAERSTGAEGALADETRIAGAQSQPGRRIRVRTIERR